jgi:hypothetical protein
MVNLLDRIDFVVERREEVCILSVEELCQSKCL